jgi:cob(I)alamin adenosyltransferase
MARLEQLFSHIWMVRTFLKHSEEAEGDEELRDVHRQLYDVMLSLGPALEAGDAEVYLRQTKKKWKRLNTAAALFSEIQPEVSQHTNFQMAVRSLNSCVAEIGELLNS